MEIIHVILGKANPDRMNGVNTVVYQFATKQTNYGAKVAVWGITNDTIKNFGTRNFETRLFLKNANPFSVPKDMEAAILEKKGKVVFHIHGGWIPVFYSIGKFLSEHKLPFVFTPHGAYNTIAMKKNFWIKKLYFNLFEKRVLEYAAKIHCIGKSETIGLSNIYKNNKTILLSYGFENNNEIPLEKSKNQSVVFGFVGRLDIYTKGLDTLLAAFKKHVKDHATAKLWIVGTGKEKEKLNQMIIESRLQNNVTLFGGKYGKEKEDLLQQMDIFIHPSRNEGLPTSVIEAASFGKPCIVTAATNIGELICQYQAGEMIFEQNWDALEKSMTKLAAIWKNQEDFMTIRRNSIQMIQDHFNWNKVIQELNAKLYNIQ